MRRLLAAVGISLLAFVLVAGHGGDIAIASHTGGGGDCGGGWKNVPSDDLREGCPGGGSDSTTTTTTSTTTTIAPTTTTTAPTTTTIAPTTTTIAPTTTTIAPTNSGEEAGPASTTTSTTSTTTTTPARDDEVVTFLIMPNGSPPSTTPPPVISTDDSVLELIVSLGSGFVRLTVEAIGFPPLAIFAPALVAIWLSLRERRRTLEVTES